MTHTPNPGSPATLQGWLQQHAVAIVGAALIGAGGGYIGGSQVDSYRLDRIEETVVDLGDVVRRMETRLAERTGDRWTRSEHDRWERDELRPWRMRTEARMTDLETRLHLIEQSR